MAANAHASRTVWHRADGRVGRRTHRAGYSGIHRPHSTMPHGLDGRWHRHGQRCRRCREPKHRSWTAEACATFYRLGAAGRNGGRHLPSIPRRLFPPRSAAYHADAAAPHGACGYFPPDIFMDTAGTIPSGNSDGRTARRAFRTPAACCHPSDGAAQYMGRSCLWPRLVGISPLWGCRACMVNFRFCNSGSLHPVFCAVSLRIAQA